MVAGDGLYIYASVAPIRVCARSLKTKRVTRQGHCVIMPGKNNVHMVMVWKQRTREFFAYRAFGVHA